MKKTNKEFSTELEKAWKNAKPKDKVKSRIGTNYRPHDEFLDIVRNQESIRVGSSIIFIKDEYRKVFGESYVPDMPVQDLINAIGYQLMANDMANRGLPIPSAIQERMNKAKVKLVYYRNHPITLAAKRTIPTTQTKTPKTPKPKSNEPKTKRVTISSVIYSIFQEKGVDKVTLQEATKAAQAIKPDTKFDESHLKYYQTKFRQMGK